MEYRARRSSVTAERYLTILGRGWSRINKLQRERLIIEVIALHEVTLIDQREGMEAEKREEETHRGMHN